MHTSISSLQSELEKARERLKGVEDNIKKSIGRDINASPGVVIRPGFKRGGRHLDEDEDNGPTKERKVFLQNSEGGKGRFGRSQELWSPGLGENRSREHDFRTRGPRIQRNASNLNFNNRGHNDEKPNEERISVKKRLGEQAITVFSRLSGPPKDEDFEEESGVKVSSQVIVQDAPSRKEVLAAQSGDNTSKERNKRMFGALLGTLQKFRQEENKLKEKEDKRALVEKKLEEAAAREKEEAKRARQELFTSRRQQQLEIKQLEYKLLRLKQLSEWESTKVHFLNFIQSKSTPKIFYLPKLHNTKTQQLLAGTKLAINRMIEDKRAEVEKAIAEHMPDLGNKTVSVKKEKGEAEDEEGEEEEEEGEVEEEEEEREGEGEEKEEGEVGGEEVKEEEEEEGGKAREDKENVETDDPLPE